MPLVLIKVVMVGAAIALMMGIARDQRWFERAGVVGACVTTPAPSSDPGGAWYACQEGVMTGFPNLEGNACTSAKNRDLHSAARSEESA